MRRRILGVFDYGAAALAALGLGRIPGVRGGYEAIRESILPGLTKMSYLGYDLYIDTDQPMGEVLYRHHERTNEPWMREVFSQALHEGMLAFDVGASFGTHTLLMRSLVGETGGVVSFEPNPKCAAALRKTVAANTFDNVQVVQAAVSDSSGPKNFHLPEHDGKSALGMRSDLEYTIAIAVETLSLSEWMDTNQVEQVDLVKMDIEGGELAALRGLESRLEDVGCIVLELHTRHFSATQIRSILELLAQYGRIFEIPMDDDEEYREIQSDEIFEEKVYLLWKNATQFE